VVAAYAPSAANGPNIGPRVDLEGKKGKIGRGRIGFGMGKLHRLHIELVLAVVSGVLGCFTVVEPGWIEQVTDVDLDRQSGALEWGVVTVLALVAVAAALSARKHYRQLLAQRHTEEPR
jgi:hypothetical protein